MGVFFGTDGLRGKFNDEISVSIAYKVGNALASEIKNAKIGKYVLYILFVFLYLNSFFIWNY